MSKNIKLLTALLLLVGALCLVACAPESESGAEDGTADGMQSVSPEETGVDWENAWGNEADGDWS